MASKIGVAALVGLMAFTVTACGEEDGPTAAEQARASTSASEASASAAAASASAHESAEAQAAYDACSSAASELLDALKQLNSRLGIGLNYRDYGDRLGDVQVAYDNTIDGFSDAGFDCLNTVAIPLEGATNRYIEVQGLWSDCIDDYNCDFSEGAVNDKVQTKWSQATKAIEKAEANLAALAP